MPKKENKEPKVVDWEAKAEILKYSIKKEVDECNLLQEALKSLQRSFKYEEEKRILALDQRIQLQQEIDELEKNARRLKDKINRSRNIHGTAEDDFEPEESESEDEITETATEKDVSEEEEEFEQLINEIRGEEIIENEVDAQMSIQQRLKLLRDLDTNAMGGDGTKPKTNEELKLHHKKTMKEWIKRENSGKTMFEVTKQVILSDTQHQFRGNFADTFIEEEKEVLSVIHTIITKYVAEFIHAKILAPQHLAIVFRNIVCFQSVHNLFVKAIDSIIAGESDYRALGTLFSSQADSMLELLSSRHESTILLRAASSKSRFKAFLDKSNITPTGYTELENKVIMHLQRYPQKIISLLPHTTNAEYVSLGNGLFDLMRVFDQSKTQYEISPFPNKLRLLHVQFSFDWFNKEGTFVSENRIVLAQSVVTVRKVDDSRSTERCHFYLFSDAVVLARDFKQKQIFKCFIPLENLLVWDVPPRANNQEFIFELVHIHTMKKIVIVCESEEMQTSLVQEITNATLDFPIDL